MSEQTGISWADSTFNPWMGCTKVSPACDNCYAERRMDTHLGKVRWGAGRPRVRTGVQNWKRVLRWNREQFYECSCGRRGSEAEKDFVCPVFCGGTLKPARRRVFCASLADWLDNEVPIEWLVGLLDTIRTTPNLDWLLLSKRIGNFEKRLTAAAEFCARWADRRDLMEWLCQWLAGNAPAHVWIGATVVTQDEVDRDLLKLLQVPAAVRFVSIEPMLSAMNLGLIGTLPGNLFSGYQLVRDRLDWVIAGGESGPKARPVHPDWIRSLRDECTQADVPFHFKQWGEWNPGTVGEAIGAPAVRVNNSGVAHPWPPTFDPASGDWCMRRVGKKAAGRVLDGRTWDEFPRSAA